MERMKKLAEVLAVLDKNKDFMDPAMYERLVNEISRDAPNYYVGPAVTCEGCIYRSQHRNDDGLYKCGGMSSDDATVLVPPDGWCYLGRSRGTDFPEIDHGPVEDYDGWKRKYVVYKCDTGERVKDCLILRPDDEEAIITLLAYASATGNEALAKDIRALIDDHTGGRE